MIDAIVLPILLCQRLAKVYFIVVLLVQMSKELGATESLLAQELPRMLLSDEDNVVSQGLTLLNEDLAFAEDLILVRADGGMSGISRSVFSSFHCAVVLRHRNFCIAVCCLCWTCSTKKR